MREAKGIRPQLAKLEHVDGQSASACAKNRKRFWIAVQLLVVDFPNLTGTELMSLVRDGMREDKELFDATQRWHLEMANAESFGDLCKERCGEEDLREHKFSPAQVVPRIMLRFSDFLHNEYKWVASAEQLVLDLYS